MKHLMLTALLFLLLGAITTILVSWMFAIVGSAQQMEYSYSTLRENPEGIAWPVEVAHDWPVVAKTSRHGGDRGVYFAHASGMGDGHEVYEVLLTRFGWPLPAMQYRWQAVTNAGGDRTVDLQPSIPMPNWLDGLVQTYVPRFPAKRRLPLIPDWPGLAVNALLYGALFWVVLRLRKAVREILRRRWNRCIACGYPIGESPVCTECGAAVTLSSYAR